MHGQQQDRAGLHLEYPAVNGHGPSCETYGDLTLVRLADRLAAHFGISDCARH